MAIQPTKQQKLCDLLQLVKLGAGVAEQDDLLWSCTVKTPHFLGLWRDEIDLITGSKGSGKSSLFRMFGELFVDEFRNKRGTLIVTGVETRGQPVFEMYAERFQKFDERQFETFWKLYILGLIYHRVIKEEKLFAQKDAQEELAAFRAHYQDLKLLGCRSHFITNQGFKNRLRLHACSCRGREGFVGR